MTTPTKQTEVIRQLTREERARLETEAQACASEIADEHATARKGVAGFLQNMTDKVVSAAQRIRAIMTRDNLDLALERSSAFGKLATAYGLQVAREAVKRRLQRELETRIGSVIEGGGNSSGQK